jgi:hypothetical protein
MGLKLVLAFLTNSDQALEKADLFPTQVSYLKKRKKIKKSCLLNIGHEKLFVAFGMSTKLTLKALKNTTFHYTGSK